jgi:stage III sporulation protein SpoIIIAA
MEELLQKVFADDLDALIDVIPPNIRQSLVGSPHNNELLEIIMDLGRLPEARYSDQELILNQREVTREDIDYVVSRIGEFSGDNRAGIERTLHRISGMRNREGNIIGLTCRVGRAVFGTVKIIQDLVESGKNVLLLGRPGIGKTTMLREVARVLADNFNKRVIVVDTSNEIAGDGDIPHPAIGHARRMQVPSPDMQHAVMIEAVENHMPEVIVIDEIGTSLEAEAARTIAERGVQLIGTAHGSSLENLTMNPTLSDLIGGIQTVTLSDEEARRRRTQKSILERKAPPTFDILVEIQERDKVIVHPDVTESVDAILHSRKQKIELRWKDVDGNINKTESLTASLMNEKEAVRPEADTRNYKLKIYLFGVNRNKIEEVAKERHIALKLTGDLRDASILLTTKHYFLRKPQIIRDAEKLAIPIYAVRSSSISQLRQCLDNLTWRKKEYLADKQTAEAESSLLSGEASSSLDNRSSSYIKKLQRIINRHAVETSLEKTGNMTLKNKR